MTREPASTNADRVVPFVPRRRQTDGPPPAGMETAPTASAPSDRPPADDGTDDGADDYRHRMKTNAAALVLLAALVWGGLWLAEKMADLRKNQDCVASGRFNCATIVAPDPNR